MSPTTPSSQQILSDPSASNWIKLALTSALSRDPVDALNDAEVLLAVLKARLNAIQSQWGGK